MSEAQESFRKLLIQKEVNEKKTITVSLENETLLKIDKVTKILTNLNPSKSFSRNSIIETALNAFLQESALILKDEYDLDLDFDEIVIEKEAKIKDFDYDLLILPAHNEGFEETFLGENSWYSFRIKEERISKIKYIAVYRAAPISGITHYAKVKKISQYEDTKKKIAFFDNSAIELDQVVKLGTTNANALRAPRYTKLSKLLNAKEVSELF